MQVVETRRRVGFLMIAIAVLMASFVVLAPQASATSAPSGACDTGEDDSSYSAFTFYYDTNGDGTPDGVVSGTNQLGTGNEYCDNGKFKKNETIIPALGGQVHVSCSEIFNSTPPGYATNGRHPIQNSGDPRIISYKIQKFDGIRLIKTCGETFEDASITVVKNTDPQTAATFDFTLTGTIPPTPSLSGGSFSGSASVAGNGGSKTWLNLDAGSYALAETALASEYAFASVDCVATGVGTTYSYSGPSASINLVGGTDVTCTFTNEADIELSPVAVDVSPGTCERIDGQSITRIAFEVDEGATLTIKLGDVVVGTFTGGGFVDVKPGDYTWTAVAAEGYEITGSAVGEFTAISCEVLRQTVTVDIGLGSCVWNGEESLTSVRASIDPDGQAVILIDGTDSLTFDGQSISVAPGPHTWSASVVDPETFVLEGSTGGDFETEACPPLGSIGDRVWHDLNANGIQDEGEPGIEGVDVSLKVGGGVIATAVTNADGNYLFENLSDDDYTVSFAITGPWVATIADAGADGVDSDIDSAGDTPTSTLAIGEDNLTVDAGLVLPSTITVEKVTDPVAAGEFAFTGDIEGTLSDGESESATVLPGTYTVTETVPDGWALIDITCEAGGSGDVATATATYTVTSGDDVTCTYTNTNVGTILIAKATDTATTDTFNFTIGEDTVELGSGESFELDLPSGIYTITEDLLLADGWELASIICSGESDIDGNSVALFVPPGQTVGCTFVNTEAEIPLGIIGDFVWNDANGDGVQDAGESGAANVGVDLLDSDLGDVMLSTTTNAAGVYVIANVPEGDYVVQFSVPEPWVFAPANAGGDDSLDSDVTEIVAVSAGAAGLLDGASTVVLAAGGTVGRTGSFFVPAGATDMTIDAGIFQVLVLPEPPITNPEPPVNNPPVVTSTPVPDDTKVAGIQTTLPQTGFAEWQAAVLALALMLGGAGVLLAFRRKEDIVYMTSGIGNRLRG